MTQASFHEACVRVSNSYIVENDHLVVENDDNNFPDPKFLRDRADLLHAIKRKALEPDPRVRGRAVAITVLTCFRNSVELPGEVTRLLSELREENRALWREVSRLGGRVPIRISPTITAADNSSNFGPTSARATFGGTSQTSQSQTSSSPQSQSQSQGRLTGGHVLIHSRQSQGGLTGGRVPIHSRSSSNLGGDGVERDEWEDDDGGVNGSGPMSEEGVERLVGLVRALVDVVGKSGGGAGCVGMDGEGESGTIFTTYTKPHQLHPPRSPLARTLPNPTLPNPLTFALVALEPPDTLYIQCYHSHPGHGHGHGHLSKQPSITLTVDPRDEGRGEAKRQRTEGGENTSDVLKGGHAGMGGENEHMDIMPGDLPLHPLETAVTILRPTPPLTLNILVPIFGDGRHMRYPSGYLSAAWQCVLVPRTQPGQLSSIIRHILPEVPVQCSDFSSHKPREEHLKFWSKQELKRLSKNMGDKPDKEKSRSIAELEALDFRHNASTDLIRQCTAEKERGTSKPVRMRSLAPSNACNPCSPLTIPLPSQRMSPSQNRASWKLSAAFKETTPDVLPLNFGSSNKQLFRSFPSFVSSDFGPSALLYTQPTLSNTMNYEEDIRTNTSSLSFSIVRPTIELPLDELLSNINTAEDNHAALQEQSSTFHMDSQTPGNNYDADLATSPISQAVKEALPQTVALAKIGLSAGTQGNTLDGHPNLAIKIQRSHYTPSQARALDWHRGLNDELNCNTYGLYCKLHKRPRPKGMRANCGETRTQAAPRQEIVDVMGGSTCLFARITQLIQTSRDSTVLQLLHHRDSTVEERRHDGACTRPISTKSDVICECLRHDARRADPDSSETPSASPGASHPSPTVESSPTLAPDSTTQPMYEYDEEMTTQTTSSKLMGELGQDAQNNIYIDPSTYFNIFNPFLGPPTTLAKTSRRPRMLFLSRLSRCRTPKLPPTSRGRRSAAAWARTVSEPPSSIVSFSSYADSYSGHSPAVSHSRRSSMDSITY
ncbi:hypothetical protein BU15DRAFT_68162 [Melanogaster broomeanus]|nr:hypothetical protein BU15DRAFT_68162 [Melanogaster broomeanus]